MMDVLLKMVNRTSELERGVLVSETSVSYMDEGCRWVWCGRWDDD